MEVLIVSPLLAIQTGNISAAEQWMEDFSELGHEVRMQPSYDGNAADVLVALHAAKSHEAVVAFQRAHPAGKVVVVLAGTDLYPELESSSLDSLRRADRVVVLQAKARSRVPPEFRDKTDVIQLAAPSAMPEATANDSEDFVVSVVGHIRQVKDPLRAAEAARLLPASSRIVVDHAGGILDESYTAAVEREQRENPRYKWLGAVSQEDAWKLIAQSDLFVLSSFAEGGSRVLSEAAVAGIPIVAARNDATTSLLGEDYPGLYQAGDTRELSTLLHRAETEPRFLADLKEQVQGIAGQFSPSRERKAWELLLGGLSSKPAPFSETA